MITIKLRGDFKNSERFFKNAEYLSSKIEPIFHKYGQMGVAALSASTPKDTGETATSWSYEISAKGIAWLNSKILTNGVPLAILIQYGHGTRGGGYVRGIDYINPALRPIFEQIAEECWREVKNL